MYDVVVKKFTFAVSSRDELLVLKLHCTIWSKVSEKLYVIESMPSHKKRLWSHQVQKCVAATINEEISRKVFYLCCAGIYLTITMGMTSLSIVLTVFVLQLHHVTQRRRPAPAWLHCLMIRYVARALCMATHVTDYYACAQPSTCNSVGVCSRRPSKRDVCLVGSFGADFNGLQVSSIFTIFALYYAPLSCARPSADG